MRAARGRTLGAVQARHAPVVDAETRSRCELRVERCALYGQEGFGSRVGGAAQVKPDRHLAVAERIRLALAEAQLAFADRPVAAATLGPAARCGFDDVCHVQDYRG